MKAKLRLNKARISVLNREVQENVHGGVDPTTDKPPGGKRSKISCISKHVCPSEHCPPPIGASNWVWGCTINKLF